jgi:hypothetical protein
MNLPSKPKESGDCNGCGACCLSLTCPTGQYIFGTAHQVCPALIWSDSHFVCALMVNPHHFISTKKASDLTGFNEDFILSTPECLPERFKVVIGSGRSCDMED